jgi:hypothetical protein
MPKRRRGRPPLPQALRKSNPRQWSVRLTDAEYDELCRRVLEARCSENEYLRRFLTAHLSEPR